MSVLTEVRDLEAVISYVQSLPYTGKTLVLMGCSQGGFVSALTAAKYPDLADRLVLFYPALCIPDDARAGKMMRARFDPKNIPNVFRCGPMKLGKCYAADVMDMDPFEQIKVYSGPVLIVHGTIVTASSSDRSVHGCSPSLFLQLSVKSLLFCSNRQQLACRFHYSMPQRVSFHNESSAAHGCADPGNCHYPVGIIGANRRIDLEPFRNLEKHFNLYMLDSKLPYRHGCKFICTLQTPLKKSPFNSKIPTDCPSPGINQICS